MKRNKLYEFSDGKIIKKAEEENEKDELLADFFEEEDPSDNTEALENAKENFDTRQSRERFKRILTASIVSSLLVVSALMFCFPLRNVTVVWENGQNNLDISDTVKDSVGGNVLFANKQNVKDALQKKYPQIYDIKLEKKLPFGIEVTVFEESAKYFITLDGDHYILSEDLRVLSRVNDIESTEGLLPVSASGIKCAIAGQYVEFHAEYQYDYVKELLNDISKHQLYGNVRSVDLTDKFDIKLDYDNRFTVILGVGENVHTKLTLAQAYIDSLPSDEKGIIDSSSTDKGTYVSLMK